MAYAVIHLTKFKSAGGIGTHIDRKVIPENADVTRLELNREKIKSPNDLHKDIDNRIKAGYKGKRAIRKDAVKSVGVILSGSHEQMKAIEQAGKLDEWFEDNFQFAKERFGEKNIVRFTLHNDEKTPHIHCVFVPIKEGKLRYKAFVPSKRDLVKLQDDYAKKMAKYGLKRGVKRNPVKHTTTRDYYGALNSAAAELPKIEIKTGSDGQIVEKSKQEQGLNALFKTILGDLTSEREKKTQIVAKTKIIQTRALKWQKLSNGYQSQLKTFVKDPKEFKKWRNGIIEKAQKLDDNQRKTKRNRKI